MSNAKVSFNYEILEPEARQAAQEHASQIHATLERNAAGIVDVGRRLIAVRDALGPEKYKAWLIAEFQWNTGCAAAYETIAQKFGALSSIERFHPSALYVLARPKLEPRVEKEAIRRAEKGETITRATVVQLIRRFSPAPAAKPAAVTTLAVTGRRAELAPATGPITLRSFRSVIRRFDVTEVPAEERIALANELMELAMQLRTGRAADGSPAGRPDGEPVARRRRDPELASA
jgi:hypothetical protein